MHQFRNRALAETPAHAATLRRRLRGALCAYVIVTTLLTLGCGTALAQLVYLPGSEFGRPFPNVPHASGFPQPMAIFAGEPTYEPFRAFAQTPRYGSIGRAVGRLDLLLEDPRRGTTVTSYCTATLISDDVIVTNYHCVPGLNPDVTVIAAQLRMGLHHDPDEPGEAFQIADLRPLDALRDLDFVLLRVQGSPGSRYGYVRLDPREPRENEPLFIIHHSLGRPKLLTRRDCTVFRSASAEAVAGQGSGPDVVRYDPDTDVTHRCDAQGGSSGALVFSQLDDRVVGLHFAGTDETVPADQRFNLFKRFTLISERSAVLASIVAGPAPAPNPPAPIVSITSDPAGAAVLVGDQSYGVTPMDLEFASAGSTTITLRLAGYDDHSSVVTIRPGRNQHAVTLTATAAATEPSDDAGCLTPTDYWANTSRYRARLQFEGGVVRHCEGTFELMGTLDIWQDTVIVGAGQGRTVLRLRPDARFVSSGVFQIANGAQVEIRDLTIEGNGIGALPHAVLYVREANLDLDNVTLRRASVGLDLQASAAFAWGTTSFESVRQGATCRRGSDLFLFVDDPSLPLEGSRERRQYFHDCEP